MAKKKAKKKLTKQPEKKEIKKEEVVKKEVKKEVNLLEKIKDFYFREYKKLIWIVVALVLVSGFSIFNTYRKTGDFLYRDVSLRGGISVTIETEFLDYRMIEETLQSRFPQSSLNVRTIESGGRVIGVIIEASEIDQEELITSIEEITSFSRENYNVETMGSALGQSFFQQMFVALLIAFISMGLVFQLYFKNFYATGAALLHALLDLFITLGIVNMVGIRITAGGIAAFLMMIGYSIDTSILVSTKLLKNQGDLKEGLFGAMRTGLTMTFSGIAAMGFAYIFTNNAALAQIMLILVIGLTSDLLTTWIGNVAFLRYYLEKKK